MMDAIGAIPANEILFVRFLGLFVLAYVWHYALTDTNTGSNKKTLFQFTTNVLHTAATKLFAIPLLNGFN